MAIPNWAAALLLEEVEEEAANTKNRQMFFNSNDLLTMERAKANLIGTTAYRKGHLPSNIQGVDHRSSFFLFFWINPKKYSSGASLNKIWRRLTANGGCPTNSTGPVKHSADQLTNSNGIILTNASAQIGTTRPISRPMFFPAVVEDSLRQMARPLSIGRPSPGTKQTGLDDELRDHLLEEFEMK